MTEIVTIETKSLGDRSYLVSDGEVAAVIDPQRDIDRVLAVAERLGVRITHVFETHVHNDYVTGGLALARAVGAAYVLSAAENVDFDHVGVDDDDEIPVGCFIVRAVHTPGHTPHHMSYVVSEAGRPCAVFTGGSMLYGTVGRTDLIGDDQTEELTRAQFRSVRRLAAELPDDVAVQPTHGFGSFCSSTQASGTDESTIATERTTNVALTVDDEEHFVDTLMSGLTAYPRYYAHMGPRNRQGPTAPDLSPPTPVDPVELRRRIHVGDWVVDLRTRQAFAPPTWPAPSMSPWTTSSSPISAGRSRGAHRSRWSATQPTTWQLRSATWPGSESTDPPARPAAASASGLRAASCVHIEGRHSLNWPRR